MPELSDVEGFRRYLARYAMGRRIERVEVRDRAMIRNTSPSGFGRRVQGRRFADPSRHGKWLLAPVGEQTVLMHFGMTGLLRWTAGTGEPHVHDRVIFHCSGGALSYRNMRRFGGIWIAGDDAEIEQATGRLGPDAFDVGRGELEELLGGRAGVKAALMNQRRLAGLGNLLSDEILWRARIHPRTSLARLRRRDWNRLHAEMQAVLRESIRHARVPPKKAWLTGVRDDRAAKCPRCGSSLRRATVAGRTACWCPRCQRGRR
jgi:formamidopyrimidine-DNA glycosylase